MPDAWRAYLEMALGLTETPRKRAQKAVGDLVNRGGATAAQLQGLVEDLLDIARVISGKLRLEIAPVVVQDVVQASIDALEPDATAKMLTIQLPFISSATM